MNHIVQMEEALCDQVQFSPVKRTLLKAVLATFSTAAWFGRPALCDGISRRVLLLLYTKSVGPAWPVTREVQVAPPHEVHCWRTASPARSAPLCGMKRTPRSLRQFNNDDDKTYEAIQT